MVEGKTGRNEGGIISSVYEQACLRRRACFVIYFFHPFVNFVGEGHGLGFLELVIIYRERSQIAYFAQSFSAD